LTVLERWAFLAVQRFLKAWEEKRAAKPAVVVEIPQAVAVRAFEQVRELWDAATTIAQNDAKAIKEQAVVDTAEARRELDEALTEVQRLEQVESDQARAIDEAQKRLRELDLQVAGLVVEAKRVQALEAELATARREHVGTAELRAALSTLGEQVAALAAAAKEGKKG
jgi:hypothetical protein